MPCIHFAFKDGTTGIMTVAGPDLLITAGGREFKFEMHDYHGPTVLGKKGDPLAQQPGPRSPFWLAIQAWCKQGKRVVDGRCVWDMPKPTKVIRIGRGHYRIVEQGDEWHERVEVISRAEARRLMDRAVLAARQPAGADAAEGREA